MAFYESFEVRIVDKNGKVSYRVKNIDTYNIESWDYMDEEHTKIFTKGGDSFIAKVRHSSITEILMSQHDEYGRLFTFYPN